MADTEIGVILDVTPGDHEGFERHLLEGMGHEVMVCHGPGGHGCPLIEEGVCEMAGRAHGIVRCTCPISTRNRLADGLRRPTQGPTVIRVSQLLLPITFAGRRS